MGALIGAGLIKTYRHTKKNENVYILLGKPEIGGSNPPGSIILY